MFKISKYRLTESTIPIIVDNYEVLHFDEFPILYIGTNIFGNKIIGTLADEDDEVFLFRYFHTIVSNNEYSKFLNKEITYREILDNSKSSYILDKDINGKIRQAFQIPISEIPKEYMPSNSSYCPDYGLKLGFKYSISLLGKIADIHEALNSPLKKITEAFFDVIDDGIKSLKDLNLKHQVVLKPSSEGSFKINFLIKILESPSIFVKSDDLSTYLAEYVGYCVDDLYKDVIELENDRSKIESTDSFNKLKKFKKEIYEKVSIDIDSNTLGTELLKNVYHTLGDIESISDEVGNGFREIEIVSQTIDSENDLVIGFLNSSKAQKITEATEIIINDEESESTQQILKGKLKILIYNLNTDSRVGNAYITNDSDSQLMDKPRIEILGEDELTESKYTQSLHLNQWISVIANATKINGRYKRLSILEVN